MVLCVDVGHFKIEIKYILTKLFSLKKCFFLKLYTPTAIRYIPVTSSYLSLSTSLHEEKKREKLSLSLRFEQSENIVNFPF